MRFSMIRSAAAAIAAATALAACGGHGVVPSQSFAPNSLNGFATSSLPEAKTSPCDVTGMYYFKGNCLAFKMNMNSTTQATLGKFHTYHGIKITATLSKFSRPPKVQTVPAVLGDAIGKDDILGKVKNKAFPLFVAGASNCVYNHNQPEKCFGKPFVYAELINNSQYNLTPVNTPGFYITDANGFPGKNLCFPAILATVKGNVVWAINTALGAKPGKTTLQLVPAQNPGQLVFLAHSQFIVAGVCE